GLLAGKVSLRKLDLGAVARMSTSGEAAAEDGDAAIGGGANTMVGEITGELTLQRAALDDLAHASLRYAPGALTFERAGQRIVQRPTTEIAIVEGDALTIPPLVFDLQAPRGLRGAFTLRGNVTRLTHEANLAVRLDLSPIDLGILVGVVPKVERALGTLSG